MIAVFQHETGGTASPAWATLFYPRRVLLPRVPISTFAPNRPFCCSGALVSLAGPRIPFPLRLDLLC